LIAECVAFLRDNGGIGVGMSSWGPTLFAFGHDLTALRNKADRWLAANGGGEAFLTKASNVGFKQIALGLDEVASRS
jgi:predicted sugar kinase